MKWDTARPWLGTVIRLFLGVIWIWASLSKLKSPRTFVEAVRAYDATWEWLSKAIGYGLPVLELMIGIGLVLGVVTRIVAIVSGALFLIFLIGLIQASARGIKLDCGCFGGGGATQNTTYTLDILRDLGLLVLAVFLILWPLTRISLDGAIARNDYIEPPSAKRMRTEQGRRKYTAAVEARRREALSRNRYITASLAGVVVLVTLIGIGVQADRAKIAGSLTAANATVKNGVVFGKKAAATVDVYEDFQCPNCLNFEKEAQSEIDKSVRANQAQVRFHLMNFLDSSSNGNRYSSRAANAALCASDISVDAFIAYHNYLYGVDAKGANIQPKEDSNGRSDTDLQQYAIASKIVTQDSTPATTFNSCVSDEKHKSLVEALEEQASKDGVTGTPTVKVNGKTITASLAAYQKAVAAALKTGPKPDPSKTPSPTPTSAAATTTPATKTTPASTSGAPKSTPASTAATKSGTTAP